MDQIKIILYKIYKSEILLLMWICMFIAQFRLPELAISDLLLIFHILLGMFFKRKELTSFQYGTRIGVILAVTGDLVTKMIK